MSMECMQQTLVVTVIKVVSALFKFLSDACVLLIITDAVVMPAMTNGCVALTFGACGGVATSCEWA